MSLPFAWEIETIISFKKKDLQTPTKLMGISIRISKHSTQNITLNILKSVKATIMLYNKKRPLKQEKMKTIKKLRWLYQTLNPTLDPLNKLSNNLFNKTYLDRFNYILICILDIAPTEVRNSWSKAAIIINCYNQVLSLQANKKYKNMK